MPVGPQTGTVTRAVQDGATMANRIVDQTVYLTTNC
jgi:hypothetical protein